MRCERGKGLKHAEWKARTGRQLTRRTALINWETVATMADSTLALNL